MGEDINRTEVFNRDHILANFYKTNAEGDREFAWFRHNKNNFVRRETEGFRRPTGLTLEASAKLGKNPRPVFIFSLYSSLLGHDYVTLARHRNK